MIFFKLLVRILTEYPVVIPVALFSSPNELRCSDKMNKASHFESSASHPRSFSSSAFWPLKLRLITYSLIFSVMLTMVNAVMIKSRDV